MPAKAAAQSQAHCPVHTCMHLREPAAKYFLLLLTCLYLSLAHSCFVCQRSEQRSRGASYTHKKTPKPPDTHRVCPETAYLAKHDLARAGVDYQLQGGSIHIQHHLAVGYAGDGQPKPQWPICHFPKGLCTHTHTSHAVKAITTSSYSKLLGRGGGVVKDFTAQIQLESC